MKTRVGLLLLFLLPFIAISLFNQPVIDDFWNANAVMAHGKMGAVKYFYATVSARYFSNFLMSVCNTLPYGSVWIFKLWPIITIVLLFYSFAFFYKSLLGKILEKEETWVLSALFVVVHIANMRSLFEGLYWMSSAICYQLAIVLFVSGIGAIINYLKRPSFLCGFIAVTSCIMLPGTAEILTPVYVFVLAGLLIFSIKQKYPRQLVAACLIITLCALIVVLLSRGNSQRVADVSTRYNPGVSRALFYSIRATGYYGLIWLIKPINIAFAVLLMFMFQESFSQVNSRFFPFLYRKLPLLLVILFLTCIAVYFPQHYFAASIPFPRVTTMVFFLAAHLFVLIAWLIFKENLWFRHLASQLTSKKRYLSYAWAFFFLAAFTSGNFLSVTSDLLNGTAYHYNQEANNRFRVLQNCPADTCYVPSYTHWPSSLLVSKTEREAVYPLIHMGNYFGKIILYKDSVLSK